LREKGAEKKPRGEGLRKMPGTVNRVNCAILKKRKKRSWDGLRPYLVGGHGRRGGTHKCQTKSRDWVKNFPG